MNDPHVESLEFKLEIKDSLRFDNPKPLEGDAVGFTYRLADGVLTVTMKDHYPTAGEAVEAVWPFIRAWELDFALERGRRQLWFAFVRPNIIDRERTPGTLDSVVATAEETSILESVMPIITRDTYPAPPANFVASPDVETLWTRYENQLLGREYLPGMGYFFLTLVEDRNGNGSRKRAARALNIEFAVLDKLGKLTAGGDPMKARKHVARSRPHTAQEEAWIRETVRKIIRQLGMKEAGAVIPPLKMANLPSL